MREFVTVPAAARRFGINVKVMRRAAKEGAFPTYAIGTTWPRVRLLDVERWIASTRIGPIDHARQRMAEVLAMEIADQREAPTSPRDRLTAVRSGSRRRRGQRASQR